MAFVHGLLKDGMEDTNTSTLRYEQSIRELLFLVIVGEGFFFGTFGRGSGDAASREVSSIVLFLGRFAFETGSLIFDDLDVSDWSLSMSDFVKSNELSGSLALVFFFGFSLVDSDFCTVFFLVGSDFFLLGRLTFFGLTGSIVSSSEIEGDFAADLVAGFRDGFLVFLPVVFLVPLAVSSGSSSTFFVVFFPVLAFLVTDLALEAFTVVPFRSIDSTFEDDFASV